MFWLCQVLVSFCLCSLTTTRLTADNLTTASLGSALTGDQEKKIPIRNTLLSLVREYKRITMFIQSPIHNVPEQKRLKLFWQRVGQKQHDFLFSNFSVALLVYCMSVSEYVLGLVSLRFSSPTEDEHFTIALVTSIRLNYFRYINWFLSTYCSFIIICKVHHLLDGWRS